VLEPVKAWPGNAARVESYARRPALTGLCARRPPEYAGRDEGMAPQGAEQKDGRDQPTPLIFASGGSAKVSTPGSVFVSVEGTLLAAHSIAYSDSGSGTFLSTTLFPKLGIADQIASKSRKVRGPPSGEPVAAVVARGEAEIGFQQVSELIHVPGIAFVGTIPAEVQPRIFFAGALTSTSRQPEEATALIRFLASPEAAPAIKKAGLIPLSER
jgi:Bacterial extracellular solute-binding protein